MNNSDLQVRFSKETGQQVFQTGKQMNLYYTDEYVRWLENITLKQANSTEQSDSNCNIPHVSGYVIRDCNNNIIKANSFNPKDFEQMKIAGKILDHEIDENGVKVIKRMDITSVSL